MQSEYMKGFLLTALGVIVLSFDALLIRLIEAHSFDLLFWRGLLLSAVVALWCRITKPTLPLLSIDPAYIRSAVLFAISAFCFVCAINLTSVANVLVIISAQPLFAALMAQLFLGERSAPITWVAIVVSVLAIVWVLLGSWNGIEMTGDLLAVICSLTLSAKFVNDRAVSHRDMTPALVLSGLMIAVVCAVVGQPFALQGSDWPIMLLLCLFVVPVAFILITLGPMRIPAAEVGMLMLLETAAGPFWVWLWLNEPPNSSALQGGTVVIVTLFLHGLFRWRVDHLRAKKMHAGE